MSRLDRRQLLATGGLAAGGLLLPRFAIGQADTRPTISIAAQQVATSASVEGKTLPPKVVGNAKRNWPSHEKVEAVDRYTVRFVNRVPDVTLEGRLAGPASEIISRRGILEAKSWIEWSRKPVATGTYKVREFRPDESLVLDAHDDYWGGRPP